MSYESTIPEKFIWTDEFKPSQDIPELQVPEIDMKAFLSGDQEVISNLCSKPEKQKAQRTLTDFRGYASSFTGRFSTKLPWKETLTIPYSAENSVKAVEEYFVNALGEDFSQLWVSN
ncbi:hypothetical protein PIB30_027845 [Stylosanthes scabra]|uniref:Uncharacterized protein n=1 Tax=Stylosanthes scabra TaxID=79078 RepID=A0ABU6UCK6_9FABA|nr:hypothetical protein [Stylosanthes scabra]